MVGHRGGPAHRTEINRVETRQLLLPVIGHHLAVRQVVVAVGPVKMGKFQPQPKALLGRLQGAQALGHDFPANAVAGDTCNFVHLHRSPVDLIMAEISVNAVWGPCG